MKYANKTFMVAISLMFSQLALASKVTPAAGKISDLSFMVGSFKGEVFGSPAEAHFMKPIQGKILGVARIISPDPNQDFAELSRIEESGGAIILTPMPNGEAGVSFVATSIEPNKVVFENPDHAFPNRIVYSLQKDGSLFTQVYGEQNGQPISFEYVESHVN